MSNRITQVCNTHGITVEELVLGTGLNENTIKRMLTNPDRHVNEDTAALVTQYITRRVGPQKSPLFESANITTVGRPPLISQPKHTRRATQPHDTRFGVCTCGLVLLRNGDCSGSCM